jgi:uridine phosphorylase
MPYPNLKRKHRHEAIISPAEQLRYVQSVGRSPVPDPSPRGWILTYQHWLFDWILETEEAERIQPATAVVHSDGARIGIAGRAGFGAPVAVMVLELIIAGGARRIISIGTAGSLQSDLHAGDLVLCDKAIRDEGVSHHYVRPGLEAVASPNLTDRLGDALSRSGRQFRRGSAWTIDTPFRETVEEARRYREQGVLAVEMEAAALFIVGALRGADVACAFSISDLLDAGGWKPQFHFAETTDGLRALYQGAVAALAESGT